MSNGLPQGSILSPLLFSVYVNDLLSKPMYNTIYAFADDIKLVGPPGPNLQADLHAISAWSNTHLLPINTSKCELIHFGKKNPKNSYVIDNVSLPNVECFRDLGLLVDSDLKFASHRKNVICKALRICGLLFRCLRSKDCSTFVMLFKIYVIPIISYCSGLYVNPTSHSFKGIERVQKMFTRRLYTRLHPKCEIPDYSTRLHEFGLCSLSELFQSNDLKTLSRIISSQFKSRFFELPFSTRKEKLILISPIRTSLYRNSFFHRVAVQWNSALSTKSSKAH